MYKKKSILAIVPARGGSKGIKNKNLKKINKITLVGHTGLFLNKISYVDKKIVSTDSIKIKKEAIKYNLEVPFMRPKKLSGDRIGDIDVLKHALNSCEKFYKRKFDYVMMLQPTSPIRVTRFINKMIKKIINNNYNAIWSVSEIDLKYHPFKQLITTNDKLNYHDVRNGKKIVARQQLKTTYIRNGICYIFNRNLIKKNKIIDNNTAFEIVDHDYVNIDILDDLAKAENLMK